MEQHCIYTYTFGIIPQFIGPTDCGVIPHVYVQIRKLVKMGSAAWGIETTSQ